MPGMPFHLEKGHALMALEDLLNNAKHHALVAAAFDGMRQGVPLGQVFTAALSQAPVLDGYGNHAGPDGLGEFVRGAWFGQADPGGTGRYWLDYRGDVDGIVREALLFAMETAWGVDRSQSLPTHVDRSRRIELFWHCAQRWFDAWVSWGSATDTVQVLFATPPHTGGDVLDRIDIALGNGWAKTVDAASAEADGDMVIVCQERNGPQWRSVHPLLWSGVGQFPLPAIGRYTVGSGKVGTYSITADAGGMRPRTTWK